ncbi:MAG: GspE/PulE family protein [Planctomycetota bacterium]|jgi:type II secretory ATPase GspE/PulE/Tfp pilus assembly ATPase PilB-like protein
MQVISLTGHLVAGLLLKAGSLGMSLLFSPLRLLLLTAWVYLCLYCVQKLEFSGLVAKRHKSIANLITLFAGPIVFAVLILVDSIKKSSSTGGSLAEIILENIHSLLTGVSGSRFIRSRGRSKIELIDPSGRTAGELYGPGKGKSQDSSVLRLTENIIIGALEDRASDVLIDPKDDANYTVRYRIDGVLRVAYEVSADVCQGVVNCIKAVSNMDISEKRRPQDGAFSAKAYGMTSSFRVASAGAVYGEKLSIRVLNKNAGTGTLESVGMTVKQQQVIQNAMSKPSGMLLLCGPTGSGKTTTLYAMLNEIDFFTRNVITVEDPIECVLPNVSQLEVNPRADITFGNSLRSILRQDPDVIVVGEIRDEETAGIALRAAQTGHLVMATVHCETNAAALIRLMDLGVSPLLLASGLHVMCSQRLLRKLCEDCKIPADLSQEQMHDLAKKGVNYKHLFQTGGCSKCGDTGYYGRIGIFDILVLDAKLKANIANSQLSAAALKDEGDRQGRASLFKHGLKLAVSGITSLEELKRVSGYGL